MESDEERHAALMEMVLSAATSFKEHSVSASETAIRTRSNFAVEIERVLKLPLIKLLALNSRISSHRPR